ncbi:hypothetical protein LUZ63_003408 [Rhynchospora breviuscula]|uniref:RING-type E3 ubiquitin transferase n=1 Tax=Rhynchospora breviuscula TaxID=2022672 RepID=A0A9Q0D0M6_9POAL|nr:hypothetical protein LUZ63_003408 [Rhynchospora breviuscula]
MQEATHHAAMADDSAPRIEDTEVDEESEVEEEEAEVEEEEDEEGDVCRICRNPGDVDNPLRYPCACSGSIKFVHQECLLQWLNHSNSRQCEVCKHAFSFSPVYAENAPARLPFQEFLIGMGMKAYHILQFIIRLAFVLSVWLLIIPFITYWIGRLTFVRSLGEAQRLFLSHFTIHLIFTDCIHGFLLSALIVFIFLGATSLRDYIRHLRELGGQQEVQERGEDDVGQERNGARAVRRLGGRGNNANGNGEEGEGREMERGPGMLRRNAENVAARLERLEAHVEQMFDVLDDADGAEDVPFDELVGMQGPVFHLVENAITVLASNAIFLGVVIFIPFSLGRIVLCYLSWLFASASTPILAKFMPFTESALSLANTTLKTALTAVKNLSSETATEGVLGHVVEVVTTTLKMNSTSTVKSAVDASTLTGSSRLSDVTTLAAGYICLCLGALFYLISVALLKYARGERLTIGRLYGIATIVEAVPSLCRQFVGAMRHIMTMLKVAFLLVIELGVFPLMCGWWLDICTLKMLGATVAQRVEFFSASLLASSAIHWFVGILYMLQISIFVTLLRGVLRPGVLYFLRDPADPNYNPFRDLIDDPVHKHARRVLLSVAVYGSLIVMLVYLPVKLAMRLAPSIFPLDITISDPLIELSINVLLVQICIPYAMEHFQPRATIKSLLRHWFTAVGWALGLTDFLLPRPDENNNNNNNNNNGAPDNWNNNHRAGRRDIGVMVNMDARDHEIDDLPLNNEIDEESDIDEQADNEYGFVVRIVILLVMAWMTLLLFNSAMVVVPISLGRAVFEAIPRLPITHGTKCNDLFSFRVGCFIIWGLVAATRYSMDYVKSRRVGLLISQVFRWCTIIIKSAVLLSIWLFIIPVLIGLLFELLVLVPMRVPIDESPVFLLYQDWAIGLIFLKIWTRLVMVDQMAPLVDESWRRKFERVRDDGFSRLRGLWVLREIVGPIISKLLTALCIPYVFAKGIFPIFGYSLIINSAVYRFAWLGCLIFSALCFCAKRFHVWFTNLHNSIRDDRYLIGRRLHNFGEDRGTQSGGVLGQEMGGNLRLRRGNLRPNNLQQRQAL